MHGGVRLYVYYVLQIISEVLLLPVHVLQLGIGVCVCIDYMSVTGVVSQ